MLIHLVGYLFFIHFPIYLNIKRGIKNEKVLLYDTIFIQGAILNIL